MHNNSNAVHVINSSKAASVLNRRFDYSFDDSHNGIDHLWNEEEQEKEQEQGNGRRMYK